MSIWDIKKDIERFLKRYRSESGASTVEFVMWLPVVLLVLALIADTALILGGQARVLRVVQDANRAMSIGRIRQTADVEQLIHAQISGLAPTSTVETTVSSNGLITSIVSIPVGDLASTGLVSAFSGLVVTVQAQHLAEN